jgi:hypothetical protein
MRPCAALLGGVVVWTGLVGSAAAQDGAGLYEPFPDPAGPAVSRDFVGALPAPGRALAAEISLGQLERGVRVSAADLPAGFALPAAAADAPQARAEPGAALGSAAGWLGASALVALTGAVALRLARQ